MSGLSLAVVACVILAPASASAETRTFIDTTPLYPTGGAGTSGPANEYPSSIVVSGLQGTVTKATVTVFGFRSSSPDDIDMVITGPNGQQVMLMSDACGENPSTFESNAWTFDDSAPTFLSNPGPCASSTEASFKPSNYLGGAPEPDNLSPGGGPPPPYLNALSFLAGGSPNGAWNLFLFDDNAAGFFGFGTTGWALTLDIAPPPAPADTSPPDTEITQGPKKKVKKRKASFSFSATELATFACSLDGADFTPCGSPLEAKVRRGKHSFEVRATDAAGNVDPTPATRDWKVKKKK